MKDLKDIRNVYFIGIGGIGMSALARYFKSAGAVVSGYDKTRTPLTDELSDEGITVLFADEEASVDPAADWVIYTRLFRLPIKCWVTINHMIFPY